MYSVKQKKEVINYILENDASLYQAEKKFNVSRETIRIWIARYQNGGDKKLKNSNKKTKYTGQFKVDVVEYMHEHHFSHKKTSIKFMISDYSVKEWDLIYRHESKDVLLKGNYMSMYKKKKHKLEDKSKEELMEEVEYLRMENAYLKKLRALVQKETKPNNGKK
ncbi:MAG: helix-turn-helix domain-containing protein [Clostridia bacterium]|nr:helix-turn-helix domain-containing protein [Clostridia bacterium]